MQAISHTLVVARWVALFTIVVVLSAGAHEMPRKLSPEFHQNRLEELYRRVPDGLILLRGERDWFGKRELRQFDTSYFDPNFKQERHLYYLTGIELPNSFVLIDPKRKEVRVYSDWEFSEDIDRVKALGYVQGPFPANQFLHDALGRGADYDVIYALYVPFLQAGTLYGKTAALSGVFPPGMGEPVTEETQFARRLAEIFPSHRIKSILPPLVEMRKIKQPEEIRLLRLANEISAKAVVEAIKAVRPGLYDHDLKGVINYVFAREGGVHLVFANNIMSGPNMFSRLLPLWSDYHHRDREMKAGEGVFIDIGTEVGYYVSDIGRTVPVSGKFTPEQRKVYDIYLPCYLEAKRAIRPGVTQKDLVNITADCAEKQLPQLTGLHLKATQEWVKTLRAKDTLGHYEDMEVLGVGAANDEPLQAGMVFAIEPILYAPDLNFAAFVEDVILVTEDGYDVLSKGMPYTPDEIEKLMAEPSLIDADEQRGSSGALRQGRR